MVNGRKVDIPSYQISVGDRISFAASSLKKKSLISLDLSKYNPPAWLKLEKAKLVGEVSSLPKRDEIEVPFDEKLVVEYYSR